MQNRFKNSIAILITSTLLVLLGWVLGTTMLQTQALEQPVFSVVEQVPTTLGMNGATFSAIYKKVAPSVVAISVRASGNGAAAASGFVLDDKGHIITNNHVIDNEQLQRLRLSNPSRDIKFIVEFYDGALAEAKVVGADSSSDLAVLRVEPSVTDLQPVIFADSDALLVGQEVLAIGNPYGNEWTLTSGIISGLQRTVANAGASYSTGGVIQTDTAINPGNSGGPLLDLNGHVIGVNNSIQLDASAPFSQDGAPSLANSGVGFSIPSNLVRRVAQDLIGFGRVDYGYLGLTSLTNVTIGVLDEFDLPNSTHGVLISSVERGDPADRAGLQVGDLILAIDGQDIRNFSELLYYLSVNTRPGDGAVLTIRRANEIIKASLVLAERRPILGR